MLPGAYIQVFTQGPCSLLPLSGTTNSPHYSCSLDLSLSTTSTEPEQPVTLKGKQLDSLYEGVPYTISFLVMYN